ncbi:MAG TPA: hypothetical protein DIT25_01650 [Candidatus Moranbacteria bacterium]|nr:hypothetical protein [Candidatus Moranbacteria bacterium]
MSEFTSIRYLLAPLREYFKPKIYQSRIYKPDSVPKLSERSDVTILSIRRSHRRRRIDPPSHKATADPQFCICSQARKQNWGNH